MTFKLNDRIEVTNKNSSYHMMKGIVKDIRPVRLTNLNKLDIQLDGSNKVLFFFDNEIVKCDD